MTCASVMPSSVWIIYYLFLLINPLHGCYIWGTDSGECSLLPLDPIWRQTYMPFCYDAVTYPTCLPKHMYLTPSREFPKGRWFNHTVDKKDAWVANNVITHIQRQIGFERNKTMKRLNKDIYGHTGHVRRRFYRRAACQNAFKNYFCWINFPRCDVDMDMTMPTCRSACENFFKACNYQSGGYLGLGEGLWRCGKSKFFNGYGPEPPSKNELGNITYLREYFPGQPFRQNKFTKKVYGQLQQELPICTPAVFGAASGGSRPNIWLLLVLVVLSVIVFEKVMVAVDGGGSGSGAVGRTS